MKRHLCLFLSSSAIALLSTLSGFCQSAAHDATPAGKLRFAVVVSDAHGAPIRDLHSDEFTIEIQGKRHPVQVQAPPPGVDQNAADGRGLIVVVIDAMHTLWNEEKDLRLNTGKYLAACAKRDVPISLLLFSRNGALIPVHEYTTSSATLAAALEQADAQLRHKTSSNRATPEVTAEAQRLLDFYKGQGKFASRQAIEEYPGAILGGIKNVTQYVAGIPGRKSLIWISSTFPFAVDEKAGKILSPTNLKLQAI
jgi:VWFA-related protein